jgi:hypothetical protein
VLALTEAACSIMAMAKYGRMRGMQNMFNMACHRSLVNIYPDNASVLHWLATKC